MGDARMEMNKGDELIHSFIETITEVNDSGIEQKLYIKNLGLTKREYFAGLAMQGAFDGEHSYEDIAELSVAVADALLKELEG